MPRRAIVAGLGIASAIAAAVFGAVGYRAYSERRFQTELDESKRLLLAGRNFEAVRRLNLLAAQRPESGEVHYLIGLGEMVRDRPEQAEAAWKRIAPDDAPYAGMAAVKWAELDREGGRLADAEDRLRSALAAPGSHRMKVRWALVQILALEGRNDEAKRLFADGLDEHPDSVEALRSLYKMDVDPFPVEAAREYFAAAAKLAPGDDRVWLGRANLAILAGELPQAQALLEACLERRPEDRPVWEMYLEHALQADRPDLAARALNHLPAEPEDEAAIDRVRAWAARRGPDRNQERRVLEQQPPTSRTLERLAELAIEAGRGDQAVAYRQRRVEFEAKLVAYLRRLGMIDALAFPEDLARLAKEAGRQIDERFWEARASATGGGESRPVDPPSPARSIADAAPELVAALESMAASRSPQTPGAPRVRPRFDDDADRAGLRFVHESGAGSGDLIPPISFSGGVGLLDFDRDGRLDVFLVQSGRFPPTSDSTSDGDRLFRNRGDGTFEDATRSAGLGGPRGYGHGVAVGDVDGDGFPDLFVTRWRSYALYRNRGDGTFEDATSKWGLDGPRDWPTSSAFADLDGDGDLDLYVCHYIVWDEHGDHACVDPNDPGRYNCNPKNFPALPDHLFRNDGGRFVDVTSESGIVDRDGRGLGVVAADLDGDNRVDLFVANDMSANYLFINKGGMRFEERALEAGVAANSDGGYQAGMGVASGDLNGDGRPDLAVTNFYDESTSYFQNLGGGLFADRTAASGLKAPSRPLLGFGIAFLDADDDGLLDLLTANGHIHDGRPVFPWRMPMQLLQGGPPGRLTAVSDAAGPAFRVPHVARGLAVGDLDDDGRLDVLVQVQDEPVVYLHNQSKGGRSIAFELEGTASNRDGVGATVTVVTPDGRRRTSQRIGGGSYQSASSPILHFGLGDVDRIDRVEVLWPSGRVDRHEGLAAGASYRLREGSPKAEPTPRRGRESGAASDAPAS